MKNNELRRRDVKKLNKALTKAKSDHASTKATSKRTRAQLKRRKGIGH
jgi:hypothetical protein